MIILFEDYFYKEEVISSILPEELLSWSSDETLVKTTFVGYHYSDKLNDACFILPKVFVDLYGHPFGKVDLNFDDLAYGKKSFIEILGIEDAQIISRLSFWIYMAISHYAERSPDTGILKNKNLQDVKSIGDYNCTTLIEIIQSLRKFNQDHQNLFTFIIKSNRSGIHKVDWGKTITKIQPILQNEEIVYMKFVNKKKIINFDEDIIVLFFSVLQYLGEKFYFHEPLNFNYNLLPSHEIENIIESENGTIILNKIRHKYFTDELVQLWQLLYTFFDKAEKIANKGCVEEFLLVNSFNKVFEDMIDQLIGSSNLASLKNNKDGKVIDHLYKDDSLLNNGKVYYIADSKYYKESSDLSENSVYKQFTYAKNIIQHNINLFYKDPKHYLPAMRDELTEGYNVVPNYFIRGIAINQHGKIYSYEEEALTNEFDTDRLNKENKIVNYHFENRLFDRDTLVLQTYNINFLYVLAKYVEGGDEVVQARIHRKFRQDLIERFNKLYSFYKLTPKEKNLEELITINFKKLHGKIIRLRDLDNYIVMALECQSLTNNCIANFSQYNNIFVGELEQDFDVRQFSLTEDINIENI